MFLMLAFKLPLRQHNRAISSCVRRFRGLLIDSSATLPTDLEHYICTRGKKLIVSPPLYESIPTPESR